LLFQSANAIQVPQAVFVQQCIELLNATHQGVEDACELSLVERIFIDRAYGRPLYSECPREKCVFVGFWMA
jgi:hypothetical protein